MKKITIHHHLILSTIILSSLLRSCLSLTNNNIDDVPIIKSVPLRRNDDDMKNKNEVLYHMHDHTLYQKEWNDYLKYGRDGRITREPVHVDYMGLRKSLFC